MLNIKNLQTLIESQPTSEEGIDDVLGDIRYICKSGTLITESLQKGNDVMQLPNGDIIINELKPVTYHYTWDNVKGKLTRVNTGSRLRRSRKIAPNQAVIG
jgi:hypothetical protein